MTAHGSPVSCPRCHAAPGEACTPSPELAAMLDGAAIVHGARTLLADDVHTLDRLNRRDGAGVDVWVHEAAMFHPDGRVYLLGLAPGCTVRPFTWHRGRGDVLDYRNRVLGAALSIVQARQLVAAAMLDGATLAGVAR